MAAAQASFVMVRAALREGQEAARVNANPADGLQRRSIHSTAALGRLPRSGMRIVYPDGSPVMRALLDPAQLAALPDFFMYEDPPSSPDVLIARLKDAHAVVLGWARIDDRVLTACPRLRLISFTGTGVANYVDLEAATRHGVVVTGTPHYGDDTVAEYTLALMLSLVRRVPQLDRSIREGRWDPEPAGMELRGKTLGILGLGGIGSRVAKFGGALGMRVLAWTAHPSPERATAAGVVFMSREDLAPLSDVLSIHLALTPSTRHLVDAPYFSRMKTGAFLINTSRGEIVDTVALISALETRRLAGAALDVFEDEPLPRTHPLLRLDNVLLTPHAGFYTTEATRRLLSIALDNVLSFLRGRPQNVVNPEVGRALGANPPSS